MGNLDVCQGFVNFGKEFKLPIKLEFKLVFMCVRAHMCIALAGEEGLVTCRSTAAFSFVYR